MTKKKEISFENSLQKLEEIADKLESEEIGLDESIKLFEEGIDLARKCYSILNKAELKVTELKSKLESGLSGDD